MSEVAIVALVVVGALGLALLARTRTARHGRPVEVGRLVDKPAVVVFTAEHCERCARALELAGSFAVPLVEVKAEVDGAVMEALGVEAVPLTVVSGAGGRRVAQFGGVPSRRRLARAIDRAANTATN